MVKRQQQVQEPINAETENTVQEETQTEPTAYVINDAKFTNETKIEFVANPKRPSSNAFARYEAYKNAKTFGEYLQLNDKKFQMADARHDLSKKFLKIVTD